MSYLRFLITLAVFAAMRAHAASQGTTMMMMMWNRHAVLAMLAGAGMMKTTSATLLSYLEEKKSFGPLCNNMDPECGLSTTQAQLEYLTPYSDLLTKLESVADEYNNKGKDRSSKKKSSKHRRKGCSATMQVGPLIRNGDNGGLLDIDIPLAEVCDPNVSDCNVCNGTDMAENPTLRQAMTCTILNDPNGFASRGNLDPALIGKSTQGRDLLAVRVGNPQGPRVLITTQVHGNEPGGTEAVLNILETGLDKEWIRTLDMLFLVRVNVDGGEPTASNIQDDYLLYLSGDKQYDADAYFFRHSVDPRAGGALGTVDGNPLSEPDFFGIVGRGYDLNRYNYLNLGTPVRPVESQALVAAILLFHPDYHFDAHGDVPKAACEADPTTLVPDAVLGDLPSATCLPPAPPLPTILSAREFMVEAAFFGSNEEPSSTQEEIKLAQAISTYMADDVEAKGGLLGEIQRFSQIQTGVGSFSGGIISKSVHSLGTIASGLETNCFIAVGRPGMTSFALDPDTGEPGPVFGIDTPPVEPCYLPDQICIHETVLESYLDAVAHVSRVKEKSLDTSGFCELPLAHLVVGSFPSALGWDDLAFEDKVGIPGGGQFDIPTDLFGQCPNDPL